MDDFTPKYVTLGNDRGFRNENDLLLWLQTTVSDTLNETLAWDNFIRGDDGRYYGLGVDIKIRQMDAGEVRVMSEMEAKGMIPKGQGVARAQLLEEFYDASNEVLMWERAEDAAADENAELEAGTQMVAAQTRLAVIRSKLHEIDLARQKNQQEADNPPSEAEMNRRADAMEQLVRVSEDMGLYDERRTGIAEAVEGLSDGPPPGTPVLADPSDA